MKLKYFYTSLCFLIAGMTLTAQNTTQDEIIFKAMQDELQRNQLQLELPKMGKPFFIKYTVASSQIIEISGELGAISVTQIIPCERTGEVQLLLGDYTTTSDCYYHSNRNTKINLPIDSDYDVIRQDFWLATDDAYKNAVKNLATKTSYRQKNLRSEESKQLTDFIKTKPVEKIIPSVSFQFNQKQWENNIRELSAIFLQYPELFNTSVSLTGIYSTLYLKTTEGTTVKQPVSHACIKASAHTLTNDGIKINDEWTTVVAVPQQFPSLEELKQQIQKFADHLLALKKAPSVSQFYCGPVLFENGAAAMILKANLLSTDGIFAYREPEAPHRSSVKTLSSRLNMKIIDNRISVKNYSSLAKYNGTPLYGAYSIDAEGVIPPAEITLVENGIFRGMLNGRVPTLHSKTSTGSSRYSLTNNVINTKIAPGTVHILVKNGDQPEKLKKQLIKTAKEDGLEYAYIVRKIANTATQLYRVDVKDGKEILVRSGDISPVSLNSLRRLTGISAKENVINYLNSDDVLTSLIYPSALLIEDVEINKTEAKKKSAPVLKFPLTPATSN